MITNMLTLDYPYCYKGSINNKLQINVVYHMNSYPEYQLISDYNEKMWSNTDWYKTCKFMIELMDGRHA